MDIILCKCDSYTFNKYSFISIKLFSVDILGDKIAVKIEEYH